MTILFCLYSTLDYYEHQRISLRVAIILDEFVQVYRESMSLCRYREMHCRVLPRVSCRFYLTDLNQCRSRLHIIICVLSDCCFEGRKLASHSCYACLISDSFKLHYIVIQFFKHFGKSRLLGLSQKCDRFFLLKWYFRV